MMIALLEKAGDLPTMPDEFAVNQELVGFRHPTLNEGAALTWLLAWHGPRTNGFAMAKPYGILGYQDTYDFHTASDVRAVAYLAGRPRAIVDLLRHCQKECRTAGRRLIGSVDMHNLPMMRALGKLGATATRAVFEDRG